MSEEGEEIKIFPADESIYEKDRKRVLAITRKKLEGLPGIHPLPESGPTEAHSVREMRHQRKNKI